MNPQHALPALRGWRLVVLAGAMLLLAGCGKGPAQATQAYWDQLVARAQEKRDSAAQCEQTVRDVEALPKDGVDPELVEHTKGLVAILKKEAELRKKGDELETASHEKWSELFPDTLKDARALGNTRFEFNTRSEILKKKLNEKYGLTLPDLITGKLEKKS